MKVIAKDIECVAWFSKEGIKPIKFRYEDIEEKNIVIKVDKIISKIDEKLCGNLTYIFECQSLISNEIKQYQLKYFISECRWVLWKI
jgi:LPS sulfotransferase NodH